MKIREFKPSPATSGGTTDQWGTPEVDVPGYKVDMKLSPEDIDGDDSIESSSDESIEDVIDGLLTKYNDQLSRYLSQSAFAELMAIANGEAEAVKESRRLHAFAENLRPSTVRVQSLSPADAEKFAQKLR